MIVYYEKVVNPYSWGSFNPRVCGVASLRDGVARLTKVDTCLFVLAHNLHYGKYFNVHPLQWIKGVFGENKI